MMREFRRALETALLITAAIGAGGLRRNGVVERGSIARQLRIAPRWSARRIRAREDVWGGGLSATCGGEKDFTPKVPAGAGHAERTAGGRPLPILETSRPYPAFASTSR